MLDQNETPIFSAVKEYIDLKPAYFRIPGHRFERGISSRWKEVVGDAIFSFDLTETPLLDDLHHPCGPIKQAEKLASEVFDANQSYFLINGTTCGNEAMIMSVAFEGKKILIPRNAHKSALMGMIISGAKPIYMMPQLEKKWGIQGGITPDQVRLALEKDRDCKGVMVVNPTYYGICSDLKGIAKVCHEYGVALLVDEAHGAHLYFSHELPPGAMEQGADMCAQSIHKVTGSLTQSSMLHVKSNLIDIDLLEANLQIVQSTSPSYLLMTSLDLARYELAINGKEMIHNAVSLAKDGRNRINEIKGMYCIGEEIIGNAGIEALDVTRLIISASQIGMSGFALKTCLFEKYGVDVELADHKNILAIVTFANQKEELHVLISALKDIAASQARGTLQEDVDLPGFPPSQMTPREAYYAPKKQVLWCEAKGKIAGEMIAPYPPGIPIIYPGEVVTEEVWEFIEKYRIEKRHLHGPSDKDLKWFKVIE